MIGDYNCTFNKSSRFLYRTASFCDGFFIRKRHWKSLLQNNSFYAKSLLIKIEDQHQKQQQIISRCKKSEIIKLRNNAYIDQYKYVSVNEKKSAWKGKDIGEHEHEDDDLDYLGNALLPVPTTHCNPIFTCVKAFLNEDVNAKDEIIRMKYQINSNCFCNNESECTIENVLTNVFDRYQNSLLNIDVLN